MATRKIGPETDTKEPTPTIPEAELPLEPQIPSLTVRIYPVNSRSKLKATATVNIAGAFAVRGFKIFEGEKGLFVKEPQQNYVKNGTELSSSVFFPITKEAREQLYSQILTSYDLTMRHGQQEDLLENEGEMSESSDFADEDLPFETEIPTPADEDAPVTGMSMS